MPKLLEERVKLNEWGKVVNKYQCACGNTFFARATDIKRKHTVTCGCGKIKRAIRNGKRSKTHGHATNGKLSPTYKSWLAMLDRCKPHHMYAKHYLKRGITVCKRWKKFENFLSDMKKRPQGKQLDRINNDLGYYKQNCRWATASENCNNRSNTYRLKYHGKLYNLLDYIQREQVTPEYKKRVRGRLGLGWGPSEAFKTEIFDRGHNEV